MFESQLLTQLVEQGLKTEIQKQVEQVMAQPEWIAELERQIVQFTKDRITAKFSSLQTVPELISTVELKVREMFEQGVIPGLENYVDPVIIKQNIDVAVQDFIQSTIDNLVLDPAWLQKIETLIAQRSEERIYHSLQQVDFSAKLAEAMLTNKDQILSSLAADFKSQGITDKSQTTQLTVMDGVVVVENDFVANDVEVKRNAVIEGDVLIQGSLGVKGRINTDNPTWQELSNEIGNKTYERVKNDFANDLVLTVVNLSKQGIDFENVMIQGTPLVEGNTLGSSISRSSLEQVGTLDSLSVKGHANIADTLNVVNKRVGVNTTDPEAALSVWDEEVSITAGKFSKNAGYIGTNRRQNLVIGTNRSNFVEIDTDGLTTIQKLRIGRNNISWATEVPGYAGTKGDIVFNSNAGGDAPFAWICLGAFIGNHLRQRNENLLDCIK